MITTLEPGAAPATKVPFRFTVPEQLHEVDFAEPADARIRRALERWPAALRGLTPHQAVHLALTQEMSLAKLREEGAVYVGQIFARSDHDPARVTTGQLAIMVKPADLRAEQPLAAIAGGLTVRGEPREIGYADFPAGEALVVGEEVTVSLPFTPLGGRRPVTHRMRQAQIIFAFPDRRRLAILSVATEDLADWRAYLAILNGVAKSVSFDPPAPPSSITNQLG
ncbi:hypothetical protein [Amycolatopsis orientalis]|uniref:hypothetical protein n=1 Tax=Amycolatopsis orientalis TaxID=31958 RepID=UPI0004065A1E|nr:hypothetical protein [Amycolatopsis orientalis]